jgi:uncharacterized protein (TIGR00661 family)
MLASRHRILYAVQTTGNGHLTRSLDIVPLLQERADCDVLLSGPPTTMALPYEPAHRVTGIGFVFGKKGDIDFPKTLGQIHGRTFIREMRALPVADYDLVISDFEPVSAWACKLRGRKCVALSHQDAVLNQFAPQSRKPDVPGRLVLKHFAPSTAHYGFHFQAYDEGVFTPVIRQQVRALTPRNDGHYTVYLPAYATETLVETLRAVSRKIPFDVFSKHAQVEEQYGNIRVRPVSGAAFLASLGASEGVLCGAGFETPAEALFLGKKLLVSPMRSQYEQRCNAAALRAMGVPVIKNLDPRALDIIRAWLLDGETISVDYPDETGAVLDQVLRENL